jgi:hypothetical protein
MSEIVWVGILCVVCWASLPVVMIYANAVFDRDVVRPGDDNHH